ncbi:hypothetical protein ZWY2020_011212 [Hordeum vulgare]|nr:hypothetical protein ZWY2020_011212 [Hordeum vulgare]
MRCSTYGAAAACVGEARSRRGGGGGSQRTSCHAVHAHQQQQEGFMSGYRRWKRTRQQQQDDLISGYGYNRDMRRGRDAHRIPQPVSTRQPPPSLRRPHRTAEITTGAARTARSGNANSESGA